MATLFSPFLSFLLPTRSPPPKSSQFSPLPNHAPSKSPSSSLSLSLASNRKQQIANKDGCSFDGCSSSSAELTAVVCPSLAYANTLYFQSAYNVQVVVEENEPEERLLNRFRREVMRAGVIQEVKRRRYFENKQDEKKRRSREAAKRNSRRRRGPFTARTGGPSQFRQDSPTTTAAKPEEDEDNWEMPDEASPF